MLRPGIEDEGSLELDRLNGPVLCPEPASGRERLAVEPGEDPRDVGAGRTVGAAQILSITCLTTV